MPVVVTREVELEASVEHAFGYLTDYRNVPDWLFGVTRYRPVGAATTGVGATFDASMQVGVTLHSRVRVIEWVERELVVYESIKGFRNTSRWVLSPSSGGGSVLGFTVSYDLPFGPAGKALGKAIEPFVAIAVNRTVDALEKSLDPKTRSHA